MEDAGDLYSDESARIPRWVVGVTINCCGSVAVNFGTNLMKLSHRGGNTTLKEKSANSVDVGHSDNSSSRFLLRPGLDQRKPNTHHASALPERNRHQSEDEQGGTGTGGANRLLWLMGIVSFLLGSAVNFYSMSFAPQSLLSSLGSVQFLSNVAFGKLILREVVTRRIILGTALIMIGNCITIATSSRQSVSYNLSTLISFYDSEYKALLLVGACTALTLHLTYVRYRASREGGNILRGSDFVMPASYATCSAIVGTQGAIQAKCISEMINLSIRGDNQFNTPFSFAIIFLWISATAFWLIRMNRALAMFHGLFIIPALQVFWTFFSSVTGGVFFKEFRKMNAATISLFFIGEFFVFWGVYLLAPRTQIERAKRASTEDGVMLLQAADEGFPVSRRNTFDGEPVFSDPEAGGMDIDWDHARMLNLGGFPTVTHDEDIGISPQVLSCLGSWAQSPKDKGNRSPPVSVAPTKPEVPLLDDLHRRRSL
jgi:hypothetical protein